MINPMVNLMINIIRSFLIVVAADLAALKETKLHSLMKLTTSRAIVQSRINGKPRSIYLINHCPYLIYYLFPLPPLPSRSVPWRRAPGHPTWPGGKKI